MRRCIILLFFSDNRQQDNWKQYILMALQGMGAVLLLIVLFVLSCKLK